MSIIDIARIYNDIDIIGLRILDTNTKEVKDVSVSNIENMLKTGKVVIDNLTIMSGRLAGNNGLIERLPQLIEGKIIGKSPIIVINQIGGTKDTQYQTTRAQYLNYVT